MCALCMRKEINYWCGICDGTRTLQQWKLTVPQIHGRVSVAARVGRGIAWGTRWSAEAVR